MTNWIDFEHHKPPPYLDVLLSLDYKDDDYCSIMLTGWYDDEEHCYIAVPFDNEYILDVDSGYKITHWTLLPETPPIKPLINQADLGTI